MKKKCVVLVSLLSLASLWMRPIMMRYRANNIMFNKQTTALASAAKNPRSYLVRFNSFVGRVKILFLIITFSFSLALAVAAFFTSSFNKFLYRPVFIVARIQKYTIYMVILCGPTESNKYKFRKYDYHTWLLYSNDSFLLVSLSFSSLLFYIF